MPTLLDLAGAPRRLPPGLDGISFAPTLLGKQQPERQFLYREFNGYTGQQSIRSGDWKAIRRNLLNKTRPNLSFELYNLAADPAETHDVADIHPEIVAKMAALMKTQHTPSAEFPFPALDRTKR